VDKKQVSRVLADIAAMMELAQDNRFKIRAYENAAQAIAGFPGDLAEAVETGRLRQLRGIGDTLFAQIETLVTAGSLPLHDELRARFPPGLRDCLSVPGLGAKKVKLLHEKLRIDSLDSLERACVDGRLAQVGGFGAKSVERILRAIAMRRAGAGSHRFHRALAQAADVAEALGQAGHSPRVEIAGSLRRRREIVRDIDLVAETPDPEALEAAFSSLAGVAETLERPAGGRRVLLSGGIAADLFAATPAEFGAALLFATGSDAHMADLVARANNMKLDLKTNGLFRRGSAARIAQAEEEIYRALDLPWIPPELREGAGEIASALRGQLPPLVTEKDLRGLVHVHTTDSDGRDTLESMVAAAREAGYGYVGITDHSESAAYAHGMTRERALAQRARVRALAARLPDFRIFHGTEADILADGSIDFGDEFLEGFDVVVASVHSRFGLSKEEQTRRLIRAVRNPRVSILGHPSGRLLLSREPLSADWDAVLEACAESGCAVEINCNPERLDLDWRLCRQASEAGILLSIGPDAHSVSELGLVPFGVGIARKGWLAPASVLNVKDAGELAQWLARRRGKPLEGGRPQGA
jgi:DNA polymerase (family X)